MVVVERTNPKVAAIATEVKAYQGSVEANDLRGVEVGEVDELEERVPVAVIAVGDEGECVAEESNSAHGLEKGDEVEETRLVGGRVRKRRRVPMAFRTWQSASTFSDRRARPNADPGWRWRSVSSQASRQLLVRNRCGEHGRGEWSRSPRRSLEELS